MKLSKVIGKAVTENELKEYFRSLGNSEDILVSLIIPVYNAEDTLRAHVSSLHNQSTLLPYEVIFVNNNSSDGSVSYLKGLGAKVIDEKKQGVNHARQTGLENAKGEIILSMDPDTIYAPGYIDNMSLPFFLDDELVLTWVSPRAYIGEFKVPFLQAVKNLLKGLVNRLNEKRGGLHIIRNVRAHGLGIRARNLLQVGYNSELAQVPGCDDGILSLTLYSKGKFRLVRSYLWTEHTNQKNSLSNKYPRNKLILNRDHNN